MNNDIHAALMGDKEAAKRLTDAEVLVPCPWCGAIPQIKAYDRFIVYECECGEIKEYPGLLQTKESPVLASAPESAIKEYYHKDADYEAMLAWNTRAPILSGEEIERLEGKT